MSADPSSPAFTLYSAINGTESWFERLNGLTQVLYCLGEGVSQIEPQTVSAVASAIDDVVTHLTGQIMEANKLAARMTGVPDRAGVSRTA